MQRYSVNRDYYTNSFYSMYSRGNERLTCRFYFSKQLDRHLTSSPLKESLSAPLTFHGAGNKNNPPLTRHFRVSRLVQTCSRSLVIVPLLPSPPWCRNRTWSGGGGEFGETRGEERGRVREDDVKAHRVDSVAECN